jgi:hypothetical protein
MSKIVRIKNTVKSLRLTECEKGQWRVREFDEFSREESNDSLMSFVNGLLVDQGMLKREGVNLRE